ncbi:hypothetical protein CEUSTIGMA_g5763.t1 [Chlamydomonas eustigma]|uniref:RING-type domain-containing protein n=1 Tax=Chlamydomonas eustigma TaxID=1157962 RepID=A0A250X5G6_9CHLO|nr:hypothetical protein CEUSTIGMA_g5763.t1 [Chlamydomonas eustigma]|eukprot:GAX78321.1 hypothetical protein CEUSTIGMA_g5763.t1 [Chlamydomonas eustigma]
MDGLDVVIERAQLAIARAKHLTGALTRDTASSQPAHIDILNSPSTSLGSREYNEIRFPDIAVNLQRNSHDEPGTVSSSAHNSSFLSSASEVLRLRAFLSLQISSSQTILRQLQDQQRRADDLATRLSQLNVSVMPISSSSLTDNPNDNSLNQSIPAQHYGGVTTIQAVTVQNDPEMIWNFQNETGDVLSEANSHQNVPGATERPLSREGVTDHDIMRTQADTLTSNYDVSTLPFITQLHGRLDDAEPHENPQVLHDDSVYRHAPTTFNQPTVPSYTQSSRHEQVDTLQPSAGLTQSERHEEQGVEMQHHHFAPEQHDKHDEGGEDEVLPTPLVIVAHRLALLQQQQSNTLQQLLILRMDQLKLRQQQLTALQELLRAESEVVEGTALQLSAVQQALSLLSQSLEDMQLATAAVYAGLHDAGASSISGLAETVSRADRRAENVSRMARQLLTVLREFPRRAGGNGVGRSGVEAAPGATEEQIQGLPAAICCLGFLGEGSHGNNVLEASAIMAHVEVAAATSSSLPRLSTTGIRETQSQAVLHDVPAVLHDVPAVLTLPIVSDGTTSVTEGATTTLMDLLDPVRSESDPRRALFISNAAVVAQRVFADDDDQQQSGSVGSGEVLLSVVPTRSFSSEYSRSLHGGMEAPAEAVGREVGPGAEGSSSCRQLPVMGELCGICLSEFCVGDELRSADGQHYFHMACLKEWLLIRAVCPTCRMPMITN